MYNDIKIDNINLSNSEILKYLGHSGQEITEKLLSDLERCKKIIINTANPRFICTRYETEKIDEGIKIKSTNLILTGESIAKLLKNSTECVLIAATIGVEVDKIINYYQKISVSDGILLDAIATAAIEVVCDELESKLLKTHPLTQRYSCGYGDLPIEIQSEFLSVLNTQKTIGLFCNSANIMIPRKSVTAIMGILPESQNDVTDASNLRHYCVVCKYNESCTLKKGGEVCGSFRVHKK